MLLRHITLGIAILFASSASAVDSVRTPFTVAGPYAYFQAESHLWRTDGTARGTIRLTHTPMRITHMAAHGSGLFAIADRSTRAELWFTEGTRSTTRRVADLGDVLASQLTSFGASVLFTSWHRGDGANPTLWRSDGTEEGTVIVTPLPGAAFETHVAGKYAFFVVDRRNFGELWRTDGTAQGTISLDERTTGVFATIGDQLLFDGPGALWRSDGTIEGTQPVMGMIPPREIVSNGRVAWAASNDGLHRTDGTNAGTTQHTNSRQRNLVMIGDGVAFTDTNAVRIFRGPSGPFERYALDFDPSHLVVAGDHVFALGGIEQLQRAGAPAPVAVRALAHTAVAFGGELLFAGDDRWHGYEPWLSGGTPETTRMIANVTREGTVRGSVLDAQTLQPIPGAYLYLNDGPFPVPHGEFSIDLIVGGEYTVRAEAPGYVTHRWAEPIFVPGGGIIGNVHILLRRAGVISGRVSGTANPVQVKITSVTTGVTHETETNAQGVYALEVSPDEWYVVEAAGVVYSGIVCGTACDAVRDGTRIRPRSGETLGGIDLVVPR